ncbi:MAG: hypothetical protein Q7J43_10615 [Pseudomonas sp.]|uniref:hypothetical protein n=1 Tax=Pseudomonas sp. TaxID=306 RepID=UPI0027271949|nr:hypothetical protein [Pseudomonas sp.]MDO9618119.1 hypothetical protein [Pseudomonas sp.]MDP2447866.1 hypothetical protein [Pseudomonas sp.]MDZ4317213.1 hypothetical protein [Azonexus sp.]
MKKISVLFLLILLPRLVVSGEIDYYKISEASSARIEKILVRYFRIYGEPCANIQILNSKNWEAVETKRICELNGLSLDSEVADAYFSNPQFSNEGVHIQLSITPLEPVGEQKKACLIPIRDKQIGAIECADID